MRYIGHRGACGYAPANTLASFELALDLGVDEIELDAHAIPLDEVVAYGLSAGEGIVIHDDTVDDTTDGSGRVRELGVQGVRELDAGDGQRVPLLTDSLEFIGGRVPVNIDAKEDGFAEPFAVLIERYLQQGWSSDRFRLSSVNLPELAAFTRLMPQIQTGAIHQDGVEGFLDYARDAGTSFASINSALITLRDVHRAHALGLEVCVYTVNDALEAQRLRKMGVDAIFSNYPDRVRRDIGRSASQAVLPRVSPPIRSVAAGLAPTG